MAPPYDIKSIVSQYNKNHLLNKQAWFINYVNPMNTTFFTTIGGKDHFKQHDLQLMDIAHDYITELLTQNLDFPHFGNWLFGSLLYKIHTRSMVPPSSVWVNGCCSPGIDKLFVDTHGDFSSCERAGDFMPLGNINAGFSQERVIPIVENYLADAQNNCVTCSNIRFCDTCYLASRNGNIQETHLKYKHCGRRIDKLRMALYIYTSILEQDINGLSSVFSIFSESPQLIH